MGTASRKSMTKGLCLASFSKRAMVIWLRPPSTSQKRVAPSLRMSDRLGGHLVSGHVDGVGKVTHLGRAGADRLLRVRAPRALARYIARKGSIAVHGVSLTVNAVRGAEFEVNLIPHTLAATTLRHLKVGDRVNLEVDPVARYAERLQRRK